MATQDVGKINYKGSMLPYKNLEYINEPFNDLETLESWKVLGHNYDKYTGELYDMRNTMPQWTYDVANTFGLANIGVSLYKMKPGTILPLHRDTYASYIKRYDITDPWTIVRYIVFLEDWQSGHYLEVDDIPYTKWEAGDYVMWEYDTPHIAANIGSTNRYTLQITGTTYDNKQ